MHLVPIEREQANNILRYSETLVKSDGSFALTNIAPGRYFVLSRVEAVTEVDTSPRPSAWNPLRELNCEVRQRQRTRSSTLKPCQRLVDYSLKLDHASMIHDSGTVVESRVTTVQCLMPSVAPWTRIASL